MTNLHIRSGVRALCAAVVVTTLAASAAAVGLPATASAATASGGTAPAASAGAAAVCSVPAEFARIVGQGQLCQSGKSWFLRLASGRRLPVAPPDMASALLPTVTSATGTSTIAPASTAPLLAAQCVNPAVHQHVELYYAHFAGAADNFATMAADIAQQFRQVDAGYLNYDGTHYFGTGVNLYVECNSSLSPVVHDITLSTALGASDFSTIVGDMQAQGHASSLAHYWVWTDGNPTAALGYAGQSSVESDDSAGANNLVNSNGEYSINYGYTASASGSQIFAHENGHAMGAVQNSAPHSTGGFHCTDGNDVMCYNDGGPNGSLYTTSACGLAPNGTAVFDCNFDDYFNPGPAPGSYLAGHWNIASPNNHWVLITPSASTTSLQTSAPTISVGQSLTLTATVSEPAPAPGTPTGTVNFFDGTTILGSAALGSGASAGLTLSAPSAGTHGYSASYTGSGVYQSSTSATVSETVTSANRSASQTVLSSSANPSAAGLRVSLTATVTNSSGNPVPTGAVAFYDGTTPLGTATLDTTGKTTLSTPALTLGTHALSATYAGDSAVGGSTSATLQQVATPTTTSPFVPHSVGAPSLAVAPDGTQLLFWAGPGGHLTEAQNVNGQWSGPTDLTASVFGGAALMSSAPSVAVISGWTAVFWRGPANHLFEAWYNGLWSGPVDVTANYFGGQAPSYSDPTITLMNDGTQVLFWQGPWGHLEEAWFNGHWNGPVDWTVAAFGGNAFLVTAPSVIFTPSGIQIVFWQGAGNHIYEAWWNGAWNGPVDVSANSFGGTALAISTPSITLMADGTQYVHWQATNGHLEEAWFNGRWNGPVDLTTSAFGGQGPLTSAPTVAVYGNQQIIYWQGAGNTLWTATRNSGTWVGPTNLGG